MLERIRHGELLELRLDRPPANALAPDFLVLLVEAVRRAPAEGARGLVLSGRPGMFSAGLDVPAFLLLDRAAARAAWQALFDLMRHLALAPIPVAAAITGHGPAGGCVLAFSCHHRVMAQGRFKIGLNEVAVGVRVPELVWAVARHVLGTRPAERLCTGGELFEPERALALGVVDELAPPEEVVPRALAWCSAQAALPAQALRNTRALARRELAAAFEAFDARALEGFLDEWFAEDCQATLRAMVAKLAAKKG
jgi:enoyl-CoA hydratase/carnithine racemase